MIGPIPQNRHHNSQEKHCFPSISTLFSRSESIDFSTLQQVERLIDHHDVHRHHHRQINENKGKQTKGSTVLDRPHQRPIHSTATPATTTPLPLPTKTSATHDQSTDPRDVTSSPPLPSLPSSPPYATKMVLKVISSDVSITTNEGPVLHVVGNTSVTGRDTPFSSIPSLPLHLPPSLLSPSRSPILVPSHLICLSPFVYYCHIPSFTPTTSSHIPPSASSPICFIPSQRR